ncbi:MAG TPA: hypothetical protein VFT87_02300 [Candidatus Saccharimonadales bacterium]|nr:hypothetical protein [Candidatus Saccharimonadales bacterium]
MITKKNPGLLETLSPMSLTICGVVVLAVATCFGLLHLKVNKGKKGSESEEWPGVAGLIAGGVGGIILAFGLFGYEE